MVDRWRSFFKSDPVPELLKCPEPALSYFIRRDLLDQTPGSLESLWNLPIPQKILKKQLPNGAWPDQHPKKHINSATNYLLVETYRNLGFLLEMYGLNNTHPQIKRACEYVFTTQTDEGDFRGIYGKQYSPNYSGGILEFIVKAGYTKDKRIDRAFQFFLSHQQTEGGWTLPMQTHGKKSTEWDALMQLSEPLPFQPEKIFAHFVTGIVLRAFASHPTYRLHPNAQKAGDLITDRFFRDDKYSSYKKAECWFRYSYPFWWNDLLAVLDALSKMGFLTANSKIARALNYFREQQLPDGTWRFYSLKSKSHPDINEWLTLTLCRSVKRFFQSNKD